MEHDRLDDHLRTWLGAWPPDRPVHVVGSEKRTQPAWDGEVYPVVGVGWAAGTVISVPPDAVDAVSSAAEADDLLEAGTSILGGLVGLPGTAVGRGVFRWSTTPAPLPDTGEWVASTDSRLPAWLAPFTGDVLVAWDWDGAYAAGVGRKGHDRHGQELSVATEPVAQGRGLARRLVAQAARRVLEEGAVPTYLHHPSNTASARVAEAAGFPDLGWSVYGLPTAEGRTRAPAPDQGASPARVRSEQ